MNSANDSNFPVVSLGQIGGATVQTVNPRHLHTFMGVGKAFGAWLPERIEQYGFVEHVDYVINSETGKNSGRGRRAKEYAITLDMAKELAMVERNEKGKQVRRYFISIEKASHQTSQLHGRPHEFEQWSNEELRTRRGVVDMYRQSMNNASAVWMMERLGFPMPPAHLFPEWRQSDLWSAPHRGVTITVAPQDRMQS